MRIQEIRTTLRGSPIYAVAPGDAIPKEIAMEPATDGDGYTADGWACTPSQECPEIWVAGPAEVRAGENVSARLALGCTPERLAVLTRMVRLEVMDSERTSARLDLLERASPLVDDKTFKKLCDAKRVATGASITLPAGRYSHCSRAKGWARLGKGPSAQWGEETGKGWRVCQPGRWLVHSSDGFSRTDQETWEVEHMQVGSETWTIAD